MKMKQTEEQVKEKLTKDIKEFCGDYHRKPTVEEVWVWTTWKYHYHPDHIGKKWAKDLIHKATWGMKVKNEHRRSDFVLYGRKIQAGSPHLPDPNYEMNYEEAKCIY